MNNYCIIFDDNGSTCCLKKDFKQQVESGLFVGIPRIVHEFNAESIEEAFMYTDEYLKKVDSAYNENFQIVKILNIYDGRPLIFTALLNGELTYFHWWDNDQFFIKNINDEELDNLLSKKMSIRTFLTSGDLRSIDIESLEITQLNLNDLLVIEGLPNEKVFI